jgi:hypothetical protein
MTKNKFKRSHLRFLSWFTACALFWGSWLNATSHASDSTQELLHALARLNVQLGSGNTADGWRRFLQLNRLESQAAKGEQADVQTLVEMHRLMVAATQNTQFMPFEDVKLALENQIRNLSLVHSRDLNALIQEAPGQFQPITVAMMERQRDVLKSELQQLKSFFSAQQVHEKRTTAFESLNLNELEKLLSEIVFELAPEISEGRLNTGIVELRSQLRRVVEQIDAIPDEPTQSQEDELTALRAQETELNRQIETLTEQRNEVRRGDLNRRRQRTDYLRRLFEFEDRFTKAAADLGDPYAVSAAFALEKFSRLYGYGTEDTLKEDFLQRIERLSADLRRLDDPNDRRGYGIVGNTLEWLDHASQTPHLVAAIRARYSLPNAYLQISSQFLNRLGGRPVNQSQPVCEEIDGRQVRGMAYTTGTVSFDLVHDPDQAHISVRSLNQIHSNTQLEQGPLKIFIQANGQAEARRSLVANISGFSQDAPYGAANMDTRFCGTSSACNIINRIAAKKFAEAKSNSDIRAASKVRQQLLERFTEETNKAFSQSRETLGRLKAVSLNQYAQMPALYLHTTHDRINMVGKRHSRWNLGAPNLPPFRSHENDINVRIHDSLLSNYIEPAFRGKTFTNEELASELKRLLKSEENLLTPEPREGEPVNEEPFSITFSNVRPIQFELDQNRLAVVVSATRFTRANQIINAGLTITLRFRFLQSNNDLFLVRDGKAELDYIEGQERNAELVAFRSILAGKLNPEGQAEVKTKLPANLLPIDAIPFLKDRPAAKEMVLSQLRMQEGWLYAGWNYAPQGSLQNRPSDLPAIETQATAKLTDSETEYYVPSLVSESFGG